jgi:hypothetical protein
MTIFSVIGGNAGRRGRGEQSPPRRRLLTPAARNTTAANAAAIEAAMAEQGFEGDAERRYAARGRDRDAADEANHAAAVVLRASEKFLEDAPD